MQEPIPTPPTVRHVALTGDEVALLRRYLERADDARPATIAGELAHYHALVQLHAIVELVLDDATARGDR